MKVKLAFIGCVDFSAAALESLLEHPDVELVGVVTRANSPQNADFRDLTPLGRRAGCPVFVAEGGDQSDMREWLSKLAPEAIFCFGWSYLLRPEILAIPPSGVIGYHPAALPHNRGRHPIIWTLALGLKETASTFFLMDEGADSGDIVSQVPVNVGLEDDAASLYQRLTDTALIQLRSLTTDLARGTLQRTPQDHSQTNSWRKRGPRDGLIDWRMPGYGIYNLVRALSHPYLGAHCVQNGREIKIWRVEPISDAPLNIEPGKVIRASGRHFEIKCGDGAVRVLEHEFAPLPEEGSYL